jgi:hypothetical protein
MAREAATMAETDCHFQKTILNRRRGIVRVEERRRGGDADLDVVVPEYCCAVLFFDSLLSLASSEVS